MHENQWAELISQALNDIPQIVEEFLREFDEIGLYGDSGIPDSELRSTAFSVLTLLLRATTSTEEQAKIKEHAERFGHRRARQGIQLPLLVDAIQLDFKVIWNYLKKTAGEDSFAVLIDHVDKLHYVVTEYAFHARASFRREEARTAHDLRVFNSRYLDRLFSSGSLGERGLSEISRVLGFGESTPCEVIVFHPSAADQAHSALDSVSASGQIYCQSYGTSFAAFWKSDNLANEENIKNAALLPGIRFETVFGLSEVRQVVRSSSAVFGAYGRPSRLEPITEAMWAVARKALISVYRRRIEELTAYTNELKSKNDPVLPTVDAYLKTGSIKQTAQLSFCHRNTVINRIKQFESCSGLDITVPEQAALALVVLSHPGKSVL
ncbi:helix-turn-helix domain-containing protein [Corynebacterium sp. J010B-136]|uniref:helix-turn-helix domain-containing protein n=1 Tax=Corynebacterium sp. J010B-136 TaxID=2099401 RepID=UPI000CF88082|nr:helix-turn-helix domain-containing protein [Corynebacterium sp. J010B-136]PQM75346.1 hypothetical protein C5Y44_00830 [Corynebacterium sp. J010B-136]